MKTSLLVICFLFVITAFGQTPDSTKLGTRYNIGGDIGLSRDINLAWDLWGGAMIAFGGGLIEANLGYSSTDALTMYGPVDDLEYRLRTAFADVNYHFEQGIFLGFNLAFTFNSVHDEEMSKFDDSSLDSPEFFIGNAIQLNLGYLWPVNENLSIRLQGRAGFHSYEIAEGVYWQLGGSDESVVFSNERIELHTYKIYSASLGITYTFFQSKDRLF
ncbi:MAG: hypothetical protein Kapaf2KO_00140 [Candidatus Kapaibacteriales bacterium]